MSKLILEILERLSRIDSWIYLKIFAINNGNIGCNIADNQSAFHILSNSTNQHWNLSEEFESKFVYATMTENQEFTLQQCF